MVSVVVYLCQLQLGVCHALTGSFRIPFDGGGDAYGGALPVLIHGSQSVLSLKLSCSGGFRQPAVRLVHGAFRFFYKQICQICGSVRVPGFCSHAVPALCFFEAVRVFTDNPKIVGGYRVSLPGCFLQHIQLFTI